MEESSRCTGHCCRCFPLSVSFADLKDPPEGKNYHQRDFVLDMLIPLGELSHHEAEALAMSERPEFEGTLEFFTCKHFKDNSCLVYDDRPDMCRNYGEKSECSLKSCTRCDAGSQPEAVAIKAALTDG